MGLRVKPSANTEININGMEEPGLTGAMLDRRNRKGGPGNGVTQGCPPRTKYSQRKKQNKKNIYSQRNRNKKKYL